MTSRFDEATAVERADEGTFTWHVPDGWQQGTGAFGGLVLGALVRAMERFEPDSSRRLRSLTSELTAPVRVGPSEIRVRALRRGKGITYLNAELVQGPSDVVARASGAFAATRTTEPTRTPPRPFHAVPVAPAWSDVPSTPLAPFGPVFSQHYAYRFVGPLPFMGGDEAVASGFICERAELDRVDAAAMVARADAWWPAIFTTEVTPRAAATIALTIELIADPASLPPGEPLFHTARVHAVSEGFFVELRELWRGADLVAMCQETFAITR